MKYAGILVDRLKLMFDWYNAMVDEQTARRVVPPMVGLEAAAKQESR